MTDKSSQLLRDALSRAVAEPAGLPLYGTRAAPGLFSNNAAGKQAARQCKDEGYLRTVRSTGSGKAAREVCAITEQGLAYVLDQVNPKQVLQDFVRALEARQAQAAELAVVARETHASLEALKAAAEKVLDVVASGQWAVMNGNGTAHVNGDGAGTGDGRNALTTNPVTPSSITPNGAVESGPSHWSAAVLACLDQWQASGATEDCPLPQLHRKVQTLPAPPSVGQFHDCVRRLHEQGQIYLHPWTGPFYEIPEPSLALFVGHDIAYYASRR